MLRCAIAAALIATAGWTTALAQPAAYVRGSVYDLDPPARQATGNRILEQVLNSNDMQPVRDLAEDDLLRQLAAPVGRLAIGLKGGKVAFCTASVISEDLVLTNHHCVPGEGDVTEALLWMGYTVPRSRKGVAQYPVDITPVEADADLDYAILRTEGQPGADWGTIPLSTAEPPARRSLFIIHHPGGFAQHITRGRCQTGDPAHDGDDIMHVCDTLGGSSGAPVFDNNTRRVVALHYSAVGLQELNAGKRIASIASTSPVIAEIIQANAQAEGAGPDRDGESAGAVWQTIQSSDSPSVLEAFSTRFAGSIYADLARARLEEISTPRTASIAPSQEEPLSTRLQRALKRVGCYTGTVDGEWGRASRDALIRFNRHAGTRIAAHDPDAAALTHLDTEPGRVCPLTCGPDGEGGNSGAPACTQRLCGPDQALGGSWLCTTLKAGPTPGPATLARQ